MIEYIKGTIDELTPTSATIEAHGVGYFLYISLNTYSAIQKSKEAKLYVYEAIREDAHLLYGFAQRDERTIFLQLIGVPGIGAQIARTLLSSFTPSELAHLISEGNDKLLKSVKGVGTKMAQRIVAELQDKVALGLPTISNQTATVGGESAGAGPDTAEEAISALTMLGFQPAAARKVVMDIAREQPACTAEQLIKLALKSL